MKINTDLKLDFKDVLIEPKRSFTNTRKEIDLNRTFKTRNSQVELSGIPIIAANMSVVGTFAMAKALASEGMYTALHKHYSTEELISFFDANKDIWNKVFYTTGISEKDFEKLDDVVSYFRCKFGKDEIFPQLLCIDVANGYTQKFIDAVKDIRQKFPKTVIMAGNVVTPNMVETLLDSSVGADIVKIGIGPGCFKEGTAVTTKDGKKSIEKVEIGDEVLTHNGHYKKVIGKLKRDEKEKLLLINGIEVTSNHEFYVLDKKYKDIVTDENIHNYAQWIEAGELTVNHLLIKVK